MTENNVFTVELFEDSVFTVTVQPANESKVHNESDGFFTTVQFPCIRVKGEVKIRGIAYEVVTEWEWWPTASQRFRKGDVVGTTHWRRCGRGQMREGYFRVDTGKKVSIEQKAWDAISDLEQTVLSRMANDHPEMHTISLRLRLQAEVDKTAGAVSQAQRELEERQAEAAKAAAKLADFDAWMRQWAAPVPGTSA